MITKNGSSGAELVKILEQVFDQNKLSGLLEAENPDSNIKSKIFIKDGQVVYATSTMYRARFGDLMIKKGIITSKELETALRLQQEDPQKPLIGNILVGMGVISERVIPNLLYHQIEVVIYEIISWINANISFEAQDIEKHPDYRRPISSNSSKLVYSDLGKLIDSKGFVKSLDSNKDELLKIRHYLSNPEAVPKRMQKSYPSQLTFDQRKILRSIDGSNSLNDIIILSDLDYFRTYQILFDLINDKIIVVPGVKMDEADNKQVTVPEVTETIVETSLPPKSTPSVKIPENNSSVMQNPVVQGEKTDDQILKKYQQIINASREEIKQLKLKINEYETSQLVFNEEISIRISRLPYHKKIMLSSVLKNIMDMVESV